MIIVDLQTTVLPQDRRVWRCFPGNGYKFLAQFSNNGEIFLDFPDLVSSEPSRAEDENLFAKIRASQQNIKNLLGRETEGPKSTNWRNFTDAKKTPHLGKLVRSVINFEEVCNHSDIVIVPEPISSGTIMFGEIQDEIGKTGEAYYVPYGNGKLRKKAVKWIARIGDDKISKDLLRSLRHENNFTPISEHHFDEVFSFCYNNFHFRETYGSSLYNRNDEFRDRDAALIGFINNLAALAAERTAGDRAKTSDITAFNYLDIIIGEYELAFSSFQVSDIRSPGFIRSIAKKVTPIVSSSMLSLLIFLGDCQSIEDFKNSVADVHFVNSKAVDDSCNAAVHSANDDIFANIPAEDLWKTCRRLKATQHNIGLHTGSKVYREERSVFEGRAKP